MAATIEIGASPEGRQSLALKRANRHGLIAGATGTGKTVTLQVLAEAFAREGVNVFAADIKGDLSGVAATGDPPPAWATARADGNRHAAHAGSRAGRVLGRVRRSRPSRAHHRHGNGSGADGTRARSDRRAGRRADHRVPARRRLDQGGQERRPAARSQRSARVADLPLRECRRHRQEVRPGHAAIDRGAAAQGAAAGDGRRRSLLRRARVQARRTAAPRARTAKARSTCSPPSAWCRARASIPRFCSG